ncbi:ribosome biogenesis GTP-binding protein YihA/YsxC [Sporosalibacterium faouarense]|uniref:ribosome biogenesis GTP-binding protein YihA/YsxC n=1 Tax=Sporosalibacterium faouarense TaxID=516123 RepID=UPI00141C6580|nr:ribosome biogenesis GTP-binding protein YihA/YsxC [Sporosalibacterium faouarense]MTI46609.1 YihA family ribosome biogenesis GTP-binding protein [Bacillota bacterium]
MKIKKSELLGTVVRPDQYPEEGVPEIAFAGRSNVGKSSLINCLINRKNLARTSGQPGKTQTLNFYSINDEFRFVDLPGYGYARVSRQSRNKWAKMIETYITSRKSLVEIIQLVDIRHTPSELDVGMYEWIKSVGFNGIVVATKVDKISRGKIDKHISDIKKTLGVENRDFIIPFSASKKTNREKVLNTIEEILRVNQLL